MIRALILDDEAPARRRLRRVLGAIPTIGQITECRTASEAIAVLRRTPPDVAFLDIEMPGMGGLEVAAAASEKQRPAIVFVTAYEQYAARAFEVQAFDYLLKPFDDERVINTVRRAISFIEWRRAPPSTTSGEFGAIRVAFDVQQVYRDGRLIELRPKEIELLKALWSCGGRVLSRAELQREVWGYADDVLSRTVDTHIAMLRRKLEPDPGNPKHIITVRSFGYRLEQ